VVAIPSNGSTSPLVHFTPPPAIATLSGRGPRLGAMAAASVWLQLQVPPHRLHSPPLLSLPSNHSSSACPPVYKYKKHGVLGPGRANLLLCSASVVTEEQEGAASDPSSEEGSSEPEIYSYKDDPNFRYQPVRLQFPSVFCPSPMFSEYATFRMLYI